MKTEEIIIADLKTVNQKQLAEIVGIPLRTLASWRTRGIGPAYVKAGSKNSRAAVVYFLKDVVEWLERNKVPGKDVINTDILLEVHNND